MDKGCQQATHTWPVFSSVQNQQVHNLWDCLSASGEEPGSPCWCGWESGPRTLAHGSTVEGRTSGENAHTLRSRSIFGRYLIPDKYLSTCHVPCLMLPIVVFIHLLNSLKLYKEVNLNCIFYFYFIVQPYKENTGDYQVPKRQSHYCILNIEKLETT